MPAELADGLARKESRYGLYLADSPPGFELAPIWVLRFRGSEPWN